MMDKVKAKQKDKKLNFSYDFAPSVVTSTDLSSQAQY